ncbi:DivIVA domain-containing protein [candidate division KSB1 bacterium]
MFRISPGDIVKQEFKKVLRGYDPVEVDAFLETLSEQFDSLQKKEKDISGKIEQYEAQIQKLEEHNRRYEQTLEAIQQRPDRKDREVSAPGREDVPRSVEPKAQDITKQARRELEQVRHEISVLQERRTAFIKTLKKELRSQIELLKVFEMDSSNISDMERKIRKGTAGESRKSTQADREQEDSETPRRPVRREEKTPPPPAKIPGAADKELSRPAANGRAEEQSQTESTEEAAEHDEESTSKFQNGFDLINNILDESDPDEETESLDDKE